ncbi:LPXTG cell wall anchor domain-containing protein, partial [Listeria monocytogenes]
VLVAKKNNINDIHSTKKEISTRNYSKVDKNMLSKVKANNKLPKTGDNGDSLYVMFGSLLLSFSIVHVNKANK